MIPEFGDIEFPLTMPTREALDIADWLPPMYPGHSLGSGEPPAENEWNPWDTVTDTVGAGWSLYRTTLQQQANQVRDVGRAVSGFIADTGADTRNAWIGGAAGFAAGLVDLTTNIIAGPILDPLTTAEDAIYGTINTYNTYAEHGGVLLGISAATGVHRLAEAYYGADILTGQTLSGDEVFDRAVEGAGAAGGVVTSVVGGAQMLGAKGLTPTLSGTKATAKGKLKDAADDAHNTLRQTGSGSFSGAADEAYDAIRRSTTDVDAIARNTGIKPSNIRKVKSHLFYDEHLLDRYVDLGDPAVMRRFDSDAGIANAWKRLELGTHTADDIQLLRHEAAEAALMRRWGDPSYNRAHTRAQQRFPAPILE